jgi:hypothetical protein
MPKSGQTMPKPRAVIFIGTILLVTSAYASEVIMPEWRGLTVYSDISNNNLEMKVIVNKDKYLNSFYEWKNDKAFRSESTETEFRSHAYSYASLFALYAISSYLHGKASKFTGSPINITGDFVEPDDYGHSNAHRMFSFTYTKSLDIKINWDEFDAGSFPKIAPDFHYTPWYAGKVLLAQ